MGSKQRIQQSKDDTRSSLLRAALKIVKQDGWHALSIRKIADEIDYTAPVIYDYFTNKESLVAELTHTGYLILLSKIKSARMSTAVPVAQLEAMWLAYWEFAFAEKELYQSMFGVEVNCSMADKTDSKAEELAEEFAAVIRALMKDRDVNEQVISTKYFSFWSSVHGLVSINLVHKGKSDEINRNVLQDAIRNIITSIIN